MSLSLRTPKDFGFLNVLCRLLALVELSKHSLGRKLLEVVHLISNTEKPTLAIKRLERPNLHIIIPDGFTAEFCTSQYNLGKKDKRFELRHTLLKGRIKLGARTQCWR